MTTGAKAAAVRRSRPGRRPDVGAIVLGGDYRALGAVRSLGRRGIPVWVLYEEHRVATASRYAARSLPWTGASDEQKVAHLLTLAEQHRLTGWALFPSSDDAAALIARNHEALSRQFLVTAPPWEVLRWAFDKRLTYRLADKLGVACPWTRCIGGVEELSGLDAGFPLIIKPAYKAPELNRLTAEKAWRVEDSSELRERYIEACRLMPPDLVMLQELIPGGGELQLSYAALCVDGRPLASITARRRRQHPIDFGRASSFVETIDEPEVEEPARRLLEAMRYTGLMEVEFKRDPRDGRLKLLDMNPRIWGWHTLGRRAGLDFPYLQWRVLQGEPVPDLRSRPGLGWLRLSTDLPAALAELRSGQLSLGAYLRSLRGPLEPAIFAWDDPIPGVMDVPFLLRLAWKRRSGHSATESPPVHDQMPVPVET